MEGKKTGIEVKGLGKSFGDKTVFNGLEFDLKPEESYALMGASGSGKTTVFNILAGFVKPDSGEVCFYTYSGEDKAERLPVDRKSVNFSVVFQEDRLCEYLSAEDNLFLCRKEYTRDPELKSELMRLLSEDALKKPAGKLSGGQKRRVAVVRAMIREKADIILMDEPFTGMDEETKKRVAAYINEKKEKRLLIISTHSKEEAELLNAEIINMGSL